MSAVARTRSHNNRTIPMSEAQLTARHRLLVEYMLHGLPHASLCSRVTITEPGLDEHGAPAMIERHPRVGEPLDLLHAATVLNIRRRHARSLSAQPAFQRLLAAETAAFREGAKARATRRMVALIDDPGAGKAADRKVQLAASQAVIGETDGARGTTVNVSVGGTQITAGVVIRLPPSAQQSPLEHAATIQHEDA